MKKLRITVEGKTYDVTVQVLEDDEATVTGAGFVSSLPAPPPRVAAPMARPQAPASGPSRLPAEQPNAILAPIAGTVQKVFATVGASIESQVPVVMLDAMKMDTYIYAPKAMTITEVGVEPGDSVQVGDLLVRYTPRG